VTSAALRELAADLVDLHGQHEHQVLLDPASHLDLLDAFAGLTGEREGVQAAFTRLQSLSSERNRLATDAREKTRREEYLRFQLTEIERVAPQPGEDDELMTARQVLGNAERLQRLCADTYTALYEGEEAALPTLSAVWKKLGELASIDPQFAPHLAAKDAVKSQLEDLVYFLRSYASAIDASPGKLQDVEDRLAVLERLKKKHGPALADVIETAAALRQELAALAGADERAAAIEAELTAARRDYRCLAEKLSKARRSASAKLSRSPSAEARSWSASRSSTSFREATVMTAFLSLRTGPGTPILPVRTAQAGCAASAESSESKVGKRSSSCAICRRRRTFSAGLISTSRRCASLKRPR